MPSSSVSTKAALSSLHHSNYYVIACCRQRYALHHSKSLQLLRLSHLNGPIKQRHAKTWRCFLIVVEYGNVKEFLSRQFLNS